jgi:hypothetical protein
MSVLDIIHLSAIFNIPVAEGRMTPLKLWALLNRRILRALYKTIQFACKVYS